MSRILSHAWLFFIYCTICFLVCGMSSMANELSSYRAPCDLIASKDGSVLFVAEKLSQAVSVVDISANTVQAKIPLPGEVTGLTLSSDGSVLIATCASERGWICFVDSKQSVIQTMLPSDVGVCSPVFSPDGKTLFICSRFTNRVLAIDVEQQTETACITTVREPIAAAVTPDGKRLFVANHLPNQPSNVKVVAAMVSVIDVESMRKTNDILLPNGSTNVRGICLSPDGNYAFVSHILARYRMPTFQLDRGWVNTNALSIIDTAKQQRLNTVLLDNIDRGAAHPWGVVCSRDGEFIYVTHAGTHELSRIHAPSLFQKLASLPIIDRRNNYQTTPITAEDVPNDLTFITEIRDRVPVNGLGPRAVAVIDNTVYTANFFSDDISAISWNGDESFNIETLSLGEKTELTGTRLGELYFNDARLCYQGWHSCDSCHPDGRMDGLNWDLPNDGIGNPKNTKNLLLSHQTPPAMSLGVRASAEVAVRAGLKHILYVEPEEEISSAIDEYLISMQPLPYPAINKHSDAVKRGKEIYNRRDVGCAQCHSGPYFTDLKSYAVGTKSPLDELDSFDTPSLNEIWRTAPYLHDGSANSIRHVLLQKNPDDQHGVTSTLTAQELDDLEQYILSL